MSAAGKSGHATREDAMIWSHEQVDAHALEADHVAFQLLADQTKGTLVLERSGRRARREALLTRDLGPRAPALIRQHIRGVVVTAMTIAHQEADQPLVGLVELRLPPREGHARRVRYR